MAEILINTNTFKSIYQKNFGVLVNFAFSKTKDIELSREIVQNTFVKLWHYKDKIDIQSSIESYLYSMVRNGIIDHLRKNERIVDIKDISVLNSLEDQQIQNKEEESNEFRHNLKKALSTLKDKRKQIFTLNKIEGLTYQEISEHLSISERVVEDNIAKALKEIRNYFIENKLI